MSTKTNKISTIIIFIAISTLVITGIFFTMSKLNDKSVEQFMYSIDNNDYIDAHNIFHQKIAGNSEKTKTVKNYLHRKACLTIEDYEWDEITYDKASSILKKINSLDILSDDDIDDYLAEIAEIKRKNEAITVTLTVSTDTQMLVHNYEVAIYRDKDSSSVSVLEAVRAGLIELAIPFEDDGASIRRIGDYYEQENELSIFFWKYTINGVLPISGRARDNTVEDGDVIHYTYVELLRTDIW